MQTSAFPLRITDPLNRLTGVKMLYTDVTPQGVKFTRQTICEDRKTNPNKMRLKERA